MVMPLSTTFSTKRSALKSACSLLASVASVAAIAVGCASPSTSTGAANADLSATTPTPEATPLPQEWPNHGSADCQSHVNADPSIYAFKYDANTWILRENKCLNFEANFVYLLFGENKVLLQDTGSIPQGVGQTEFTRLFPLRDTVEKLIQGWLTAHPNADGSARTRDSIELLVTHSHSHGDHVSGDYQFRAANGQPFPHTSIAGLRPADVASFFGITDWPNKATTLDLGKRQLDVLPIPGHEPAHIAVYDHGTNVLLSGDSLYPGHLFVNDWTSYRASMQRLSQFMHAQDPAGAAVRPVAYVLGNHIEKKPAAGQFYPYPSWIQDPERKLELFLPDLDLLVSKTSSLGTSSPHREVFLDEFSIDAQ